MKVVCPQARDLEASKEKSGLVLQEINYKLGLQFQDAGGRERHAGPAVTATNMGLTRNKFFPKTQGGTHQDVEMASVPAEALLGLEAQSLSSHPIASPLPPFPLSFSFSPTLVDPVWTLKI